MILSEVEVKVNSVPMPVTNEVCAVLTLNAYQAFQITSPKKIDNLCNTNKHV